MQKNISVDLFDMVLYNTIMKIGDIKKTHFGRLCEAVVITYLPKAIWRAREVGANFYNYDIEWNGINIEVKGTKRLKNGNFVFSYLRKLKYSSSKSNMFWKDKRPSFHVFVFVGWDKDSCVMWCIDEKKIHGSHNQSISVNSKWNKYKIEDLRELPNKIEKEFGI